MLGSSILELIKFRRDLDLHSPTRKNLDLLNQSQVKNYMNDFDFDIVIHCAAKVGGIADNIANPTQYILNNLIADSNLVSEALNSGVKSFLYISSSCVYPAKTTQPMQEKNLFDGKLEETNESYAIAKLSGMQLMKSVSGQYGLNYKSLILSNLYGPRDNFDLANAHLLGAAIHKIGIAKREGTESVGIWGDGTARREFTYVGDVASWIVKKLEKLPSLPQTLNLGQGKEYTILEYYQNVADVLEYQGRFEFDLNAPVGLTQKLLDSSIASSKFGWNPQTNLYDGISSSYDWWLKNAGS